MNLKGKLITTACTLIASMSVFCGTGFAENEQKGLINANNVNIRTGPSTRDKIITRLSSGHAIAILDDSEEWYKIRTGDVEAWVYGVYVSLESEITSVGVITASNVNFRTEPSLQSTIISRLWSGATVDIIGRNNEWYNIRTQYGTEGWVFHTLITPRSSNVSRGRSVDRSTGLASSLGHQIVDYSRRFLGTRYVYGGSSTNGFDCSGFTQFVFNHQTEVRLNRVASSQALQGTFVARNELVAGDLVFFANDNSGNYINHVGIYIGNGDFIHASSGSRKIIISNLSNSYYARNYRTARRII